VGNGTFFSAENIEYILGWMHGAEKVYGVRVDYMGVWNEPPIGSLPLDWLVSLRLGLDTSGYNHTKIIAADGAPTSGLTLSLMKAMVARQDVRDAVDVIGTHGFWSGPPSDFTTLVGTDNKQAWVSESWHQMGSWYGAMGMVSKVIDAHLHGNYTGWTACGLFAAYPNVLCQDKGLMYATHPWGPVPSYNVQPTIFTTAHVTQFTKVGWRFLQQGHGSGVLGNTGGSFVSLVSDSNHETQSDSMTDSPPDLSIIVNGFNLNVDSLNVSFAINMPPRGSINVPPRGSSRSSAAPTRLQVWTSSEDAVFVRGKDVPLTISSSSGGGGGGGSGSATFQLQLLKGTVVSMTTMADGAIAKGSHAHSEISTLFPLPHNDSFDAYPVGRSPLYFTDWDGSFSIEQEKKQATGTRQRGMTSATAATAATIIGTAAAETNRKQAVAADHDEPGAAADTAAERADAVNMVLRQQVVQRPIRWHCTDVDPITMISTGYQNYQAGSTHTHCLTFTTCRLHTHPLMCTLSRTASLLSLCRSWDHRRCPPGRV
jgi:hypothetical protein